jgi:hypothetical protein
MSVDGSSDVDGGGDGGSGGSAGTIISSASYYVPGLGAALTASDVAAALHMPLTLAGEALLVAEGAGLLCRDDGPQGLCFFRNFFAEAQPVWPRPAAASC